MSKRSRNRVENHSLITPTQPITNPMRGVDNSARAFKALRSAEAAKLRQNLLQVFNYETQLQQARTRRGRPSENRSHPEVSARRHLPSVNEMSSKRVPAQVRDYLLDGTRVLSCYRREARKETLFALRRIGKGKSGRRIRKAKWTDKSYLRCK